MKKRIIESMEVVVAMPDAGVLNSAEAMMSEWVGVPYPQLSLLLVNTRALAIIHQTHHWQSKGDPFYGDHLLFERIYGTVNAEIDQIAEKAVGLGSDENVNVVLHTSQLARVLQGYGTASIIPQASELARRSLLAEVGYLRVLAFVVDTLKSQGMLTRGLDNMLAGMEDAHEGNVYLLKQRCSVRV